MKGVGMGWGYAKQIGSSPEAEENVQPQQYSKKRHKGDGSPSVTVRARCFPVRLRGLGHDIGSMDRFSASHGLPH